LNKEKNMKSISKMKMRTLALSLVLALGLVLSLSTSPVYGSATSSIITSDNITQEARSVLEGLRQAYSWAKAGYDWLFGVANNSASAAYPSDALDR
jgi:hypothetical protein